MRAHPIDYELIAPGALPAVLALLAQEPGAWLPIAGGTDVMVQYAAGRLSARKLVSIWNLPELRRIEILPAELQIGAGCTYTDLREHELVSREFPLLSSAASWTGGIANQNRGTIGGNIVNASPAADTPPALLVYAAELEIVSRRGSRWIPYAGFHRSYKVMDLASDELLARIRLPRRFREWKQSYRKVGTRRAQAISKVCFAAAVKGDRVRIGLGSVAPVPLLVEGARGSIRTALESALLPIDDLRSTASYRRRVAMNLLEQILE